MLLQKQFAISGPGLGPGMWSSLVLTDKGNKDSFHRRPGSGAGRSQQRADILMGDNIAGTWGCSLPAPADVGWRRLGRWEKTGPGESCPLLFHLPSTPSLSLRPSVCSVNLPFLSLPLFFPYFVFLHFSSLKITLNYPSISGIYSL